MCVFSLSLWQVKLTSVAVPMHCALGLSSVAVAPSGGHRFIPPWLLDHEPESCALSSAFLELCPASAKGPKRTPPSLVLTCQKAAEGVHVAAHHPPSCLCHQPLVLRESCGSSSGAWLRAWLKRHPKATAKASWAMG